MFHSLKIFPTFGPLLFFSNLSPAIFTEHVPSIKKHFIPFHLFVFFCQWQTMTRMCSFENQVALWGLSLTTAALVHPALPPTPLGSPSTLCCVVCHYPWVPAQARKSYRRHLSFRHWCLPVMELSNTPFNIPTHICSLPHFLNRDTMLFGKNH